MDTKVPKDPPCSGYLRAPSILQEPDASLCPISDSPDEDYFFASRVGKFSDAEEGCILDLTPVDAESIALSDEVYRCAVAVAGVLSRRTTDD